VPSSITQRLRPDFRGLDRVIGPPPPTAWGPGPQRPHSRLAQGWTILALLLLAAPAAAQPAAAGPTSAPVASEANLDGIYLALGPVGAASHGEDGWIGTFGAEVLLVRVHERSPLAATGLGLGAVRYSEQQRGRLWADLTAATRRPFGVAVGLGAGPVVEVDEIRHPRWGFQGSLWLYAGIVPFLRAGAVSGTGRFLELGVRIPLPAVRW